MTHPFEDIELWPIFGWHPKVHIQVEDGPYEGELPFAFDVEFSRARPQPPALKPGELTVFQPAQFPVGDSEP